MSAAAAIEIGPAVLRAVRAHAREAAPEECCGFLLGRPGRVEFAVRMANRHRSPRVAFRVGPAEHIQVRRLLRQIRPRIEIVGVYHSHPAGTARPSARDIAEAHDAGWIYLIAGRGGREIRCLRIRNGVATAAPIRRIKRTRATRRP